MRTDSISRVASPVSLVGRMDGGRSPQATCLGYDPGAADYWVSTFCPPGRNIVTQRMTEKQVLGLDPSSSEFFSDLPFGRTQVFRPDGKVLRFPRGLVGAGEGGMRILYATMARLRSLTPHDVSKITDMPSLLTPSLFEAHFKRVRKVFEESCRRPRPLVYFLHSARDPYRVWWNGSYCVIEPQSWLDEAEIHPEKRLVLFHAILWGQCTPPAHLLRTQTM